MKILYKKGKIYVSEKKCFVKGSLAVTDGIISEIFFEEDVPHTSYDEVVDLDGRYLVPGLIDVHSHGRIGGDFVCADNDIIKAMSDSFMKRGVTGVMATLASAAYADLEGAIDKIADVTENNDTVYLGIHLEGRYLNQSKRGAHAPNLLASLNASEITALIQKMKRAGHAHVSAALELDSDGSFTSAVLNEGATLGLAHTDATYLEAIRAFENGAIALTHTFNAMSPFHHRDGGAVGAGLLTDGIYCELIADGFHVAPEAVRMAYRLKGDNIVLISDSMEATEMDDGEYQIAGLPVTVRNGRATTHDGVIAGSTLTLMEAVKNLATFSSISFADALYCATASPAKMIGAYERVGSLDVGKLANMLVLDDEYNIHQVIFKGKKI